jgi:hypothetical protein
MTFDYKKYSLENLENWLYDALNSAEASPQEIYDTIKGVVKENYDLYKKLADNSSDLLELLNGYRLVDLDTEDYPVPKVEEKLGTSIQQPLRYTEEELDGMFDEAKREEEELISKGYFRENGFWQKPKTSWVVEVSVDGLTGDAFIPIPDEVMELVEWDLYDELEMIDNKNGSWILQKVKRENTNGTI